MFLVFSVQLIKRWLTIRVYVKQHSGIYSMVGTVQTGISDPRPVGRLSCHQLTPGACCRAHMCRGALHTTTHLILAAVRHRHQHQHPHHTKEDSKSSGVACHHHTAGRWHSLDSHPGLSGPKSQTSLFSSAAHNLTHELEWTRTVKPGTSQAPPLEGLFQRVWVNPGTGICNQFLRWSVYHI